MLSALLPVLAACATSSAAALEWPTLPPLPPPMPFPTLIGGQATVVWQWHPAFHSPYQGPHSFTAPADNEASQTYTLYTGIRPWSWLQIYTDPEMVRGHGIGDALGLGGYTNGEVIRNPDIGNSVYLARCFLRATLPLGDTIEPVDTDQLQIGGTFPRDRLVLIFGILSTTDLFDTNRYANNTRTQFLNWSFITDVAFDFAADTRG